MRKIIIASVLILFALNSKAQKFLTNSQVDYWPKKDGTIIVPESYNRVSSYLYIINKQQFLNIFNGVQYSEEDRKKLGIKKNDKPDFLQMKIDIKHPSIAKNNAFSIPLFLFDFRDPNASNTFSNYNGMILNDIKANELNSDVMGAINVKALISNASVNFWKDIAKISADLGKSATSIALGNPAGISDLTNKLTGYIDEGIKALDKLSNGDRTENHSFFVKLVDREANPSFDEIVTSARLYQIHWSVDNIAGNKLDFFSELKDETPNKFEMAVDNRDLPLVLVIETRSQTIIDKGNPEFTNEYKTGIAEEYDNYPLQEHQIFKDYYRNFNSSFNAFNYINNFNATVLSNNTDWNSLVNAIDFSYQFKSEIINENLKYNSNTYSSEFKNRYKIIRSRYETLDHKVNELYRNNQRNIHVEMADGVIKSLISELDTNSISLNKEYVYSELVTLSNYDNIIRNISANASISNASYHRYKALKSKYENFFYSQISKNPPTSNQGKINFYKNIITSYPECKTCISQSNLIIETINKQNQRAIIENYIELSNNQYLEFNGCRKQIENDIVNIKSNIDASLDEFEKKLAVTSLTNLENNLKIWKDNNGKETQSITSEQVGIWTAAILDSRKKIKIALLELKRINIISDNIKCLSDL